MEKYISRHYIDSKMLPVKQLIHIVDSSETDDLTEIIFENMKKEIVFAMATIAKELGEKIPEV